MAELNINEVIENRQHQSEVLSHLIDALADQYKVVAAETANFAKLLFDADQRRQNGARLLSPPVHGLDGLEARVRAAVEYRLFGTGDGGTVDLTATVRNENASAAKFVADMAEVR